ncbi:MAG: hypothetical protein KF814_14440 [Nitrospiraceae bacterium]|nr:hypothetical protein [Nitrospiraceae bacterium]
MRTPFRHQILAIVAGSLLVSACQSAPQATSNRYNNGAFMDLWGTYTHCLATDQFLTANLDSTKLRGVSANASAQTTLETLVPTALRKHLTQSSPRLAVDLHAMAASCSLHTGTLAASVGEFDVARAQFRQVVAAEGQGQTRYYVDLARTKLAELELALQASAR